jgi:predicted permease
VLTLLIIGSVGYLLARKGWFTPESKALLPRLVILVALPPCMLYNITASFSRDELLHLVYGALVPFASISIAFGLSLLAAKALRVSEKRRGVFSMTFTASNTIFIGLPVNMALFGEAALPYVLLYYFANTTFVWTIGSYMVALDGEGPKMRLWSLGTVKQVLSPPMIGFLSGIALLLLNIELPFFITNAAKYLGELTTPLIIMFLGVILQGMRLGSITITRELAAILIGRFIVSPLIIVLLCLIFPLPELMRKVFIIQASLPANTGSTLIAEYHKADGEFATVVVSASTLLSLITIPTIMILISH